MIAKEQIYKIPGKEISWAGECPWTGELCFGTHDGFLYFDLGGVDRVPIGFKICSESINDVAFLGDDCAVSSRLEIILLKRIDSKSIKIISCFPFGSFGVIGTKFGFLFPIGDIGVLLIDNQKPNEKPRVLLSSAMNNPNCYRLLKLDHDTQKSVIVSASRETGLFIFDIHDLSKVNSRYFLFENDNIDIIDVCSISDETRPYAVAIIDRSRSIYLIENVLENPKSISFHCSEIKGSAYSIHSIGGDLIVHTDREIDLIPGLAREFLEGNLMDALGQTRIIKCLTIESEEIFFRGEKSILILVDSEILEYPLLNIPFTLERETQYLKDEPHTISGNFRNSSTIEIEGTFRSIDITSKTA
jgi:hypothetical protein